MNTLLQFCLKNIRILGKHAGILQTELIRNTYQTLQHHLQLLILAHHTRIFVVEEFYQAAHQVLITSTNSIEIKEFADAVKHVLLLQITDLLLGRRSKLTVESIHRLTADDGSTRQRLTEHHSLQSLAAAQSHVGLTMGKGMGSIDDGVFEGKALTLVDGNRPSQAQRVLSEFSLYRLLYLLGLLIDRIFRIHPLHLLQLKLLIRILASHDDLISFLIGFHTDHLTNHTIIEAVLRVVLDKHHLCSGLQGKHEISRIR